MAPSSRPQPNRRSRTFTGCLTCRRRKVKCPDTKLPCRSCCRLKLDCEAPITKNIRVCSQNGTGRLSGDVETTVLGPETPETSQSEPPLSAFQGNAVDKTRPPLIFPKLNASDYHGSPFDASSLAEQDRFRTLGQTTVSPGSCWRFTSLSPETESDRFSAAPRGALLLGSDIQEAHLASTPYALESNIEQFFDPQLEWSEDYLSSLQEPNSSMTVPLDISETSNGNGSVMNSPLSEIRLNLALAAKEPEALQYYKERIATGFSVKDARWNIFTCLLKSNCEFPRSPLKSSLIAWTATHLAMSKSDFNDLALLHYSVGSIDVTGLLEQFTASELKKTPQSSALQMSQVSMLLASSFFLCQRDVMICNTSGFRQRIGILKEIVRSSWNSLSTCLTGMDYRLLLWLSYLEVRASTFRRRVNSGGQGEFETSLLMIISKEEGLRSAYRRSRTYLHEGFGRAYPSSELQGDMLQDTVNVQFAEAMLLLDEMISLNTEKLLYFCDKAAEDTSSDLSPLGIQKRLRDLRKECDLSLKGFLKNDQVYVTRTSYHWLNLDIMCCCAIILLSRHLNYSISPDPEAQSAARDIIKTILKLKNANMLHNPHSMFSPFPLFIAGIEVNDEVYRDWKLNILGSFSFWGLHVQKATLALRRVIEKQEELKFRCSMKEIIDILDDEVLL